MTANNPRSRLYNILFIISIFYRCARSEWLCLTLFYHQNWLSSRADSHCQSFWLIILHGVYQQFTCVDHTVIALALYRPGLAVSALPRGSAYGFPQVLFRQLHTMGLLPVRMCRWALMDEHQVLYSRENSIINRTTYATSRRTRT